MPPIPTWFAGRADVARLIAERCPNGSRLLPTRANGAPAFGFYRPDESGALPCRAIQVLTIRDGRIAGVVAFHDPALFPVFGLPTTYR